MGVNELNKKYALFAKVAISLLLLFSVINLNFNSVKAASWRKNIPTSICGNYHNSKLKLTVEIKRKSIFFMPDNGAAVSPIKHIYSKKLGKSTYAYKRYSFKSSAVILKFSRKKGRVYLRVKHASSILDRHTYVKMSRAELAKAIE